MSQLNPNETTFEEGRRQLMRWPYTIHAIDGSLNTQMIEARARQILYQALNNRNVTAFVGTGVSAAYGRLGWWPWKERQLSVVRATADAFLAMTNRSIQLIETTIDLLEASGHSPAGLILDDRQAAIFVRSLEIKLEEVRFVRAKIDGLNRSFERANSDNGEFPGGESLPILFQIAEQLHNQLREFSDRFLPGKLGAGASVNGEDLHKDYHLDKAWLGFQLDSRTRSALRKLASILDENLRLMGREGETCSGRSLKPQDMPPDPNDPRLRLGERQRPGVKATRAEAEELFDVRRRAFAMAWFAYFNQAVSDEARLSFSDLTKVLLVDECAHAEHLLSDALVYGEKSGRMSAAADSVIPRKYLKATRKDNLRRDVRGIREYPERYAQLAFFKRDSLAKILDTIDSENEAQEDRGLLASWSGTRQIARNLIEELKTREQIFLSPTHRYLAQTLLMLMEDPAGLQQGGSSVDSAVLDALAEEVKEDDFRSRRSLIDPALDPIDKISLKLGIHKFLTTNYDLEIERFYQDRGYRNFERLGRSDPSLRQPDDRGGQGEEGRGLRVDGIGGRMRDLRFSRETASELISFAVDEDAVDASVFHLHGRATPDSELVITERDYMDLYLKNDHDRELVNDGIRLAFSASPILFVGLGMSEADVLRPLRQFMSDQDRTMGYASIVLLPADIDLHTRDKWSSGLYLRYGVHTVFFGDGRVIRSDEMSGRLAAERGGDTIDWLCRIVQLITQLRDATQKEGERLETLSKGLEISRSSDTGSIETDTSEAGRPYATAESFEYLREAFQKERPDLKRLTAALGVFHDDEAFARDFVLPHLFGHSVQAAASFTTDMIGALADCEFRSLAMIAAPRMSARNEDRRLSAYAYLGNDLRILSNLVGLTAGGLPQLYGAFDLILESGSCPTAKFLALAAPKGAPQDVLRAARRDLRARKAALDGIKNAVLTGSLSAALDGVELDWQNWWEQWQQSPPHRRAMFREYPAVEIPGRDISKPELSFVLPPRFVRHRIRNTITDLDPLDDAETIAKTRPKETRIIAFDAFIKAVRARARTASTDGTLGRGRRVYAFAARRGLGKGVMFSTLLTQYGLRQFLQASWGRDEEGVPLIHEQAPRGLPIPVHMAGIFINLSFGVETGSVLDMLCAALRQSVARLEQLRGSTEDTASRRGELGELRRILTRESEPLAGTTKELATTDNLREALRGLSRLNELSELIKRFREMGEFQVGGKRIQARLMFCFNSFDMLFDQEARPKNREIQEILDAVFSRSAETLPFDIVVITDDPGLQGLGAYASDGQTQFLTIVRSDIDNEPLQSVQEMQRRTGLPFLRPARPESQRSDTADSQILKKTLRAIHSFQPRTRSAAKTESKIGSSDKIFHVHFAREAKPEHLLVDNFLPLAGVLLVRYLVDRADGQRGEEFIAELAAVLPRGPGAMNEFGVHSLRTAPNERDQAWWDKPIQQAVEAHDELDRTRRERCEAILLTVLQIAWRHRTTLGVEVEELLQGEAPEDRESMFEALAGTRDEISATHGVIRPERLTDEDRAKALESLREILLARYSRDGRSREQWRDIQRRLGGGRYSITLLLACAQRIALSRDHMGDAAEAVLAFIRKSLDQVRATSEARRESIILSTVLDAYEAFHRIGAPRDDIELHLLILRQLAVAGVPMTADVIVRAPAIRDYLDQHSISTRKATEAAGSDHSPVRRRTLAMVEALTELSERGLVFKLEPHTALEKVREAEKTTASGVGRDHFDHRFALHRLVQRHIVDKMGGAAREFIAINNFAPTLFASMPADLPRLRHEAHRFLESTVQSLSEYPDASRDDSASEHWHFRLPQTVRGDRSVRDVTVSVQALRVALAIVRSTYSVAVVSRFDEFASEPDAATVGGRGHFEAYRVQVRWLIRRAWELLQDEKKFERGYLPDDPAFHHQINALYRDEIVWLYNECGVICLVQGNLREAVGLLRQALEFNRDIEGDADGGPIHNHISLNLALTQLNRGRTTAAESRLLAIARSEPNADGRVTKLSILAMGFLGLVAHLTSDPQKAEKQYGEALIRLRDWDDKRACAILLRHRADLARSRGDFKAANKDLLEAASFASVGGHADVGRWIEVSSARNTFETAIRDERAPGYGIGRQLASVVDYAQQMEIPALLCDANCLRAEILLHQGEAEMAGRLLSRNLAVIKRAGMDLRLSANLAHYANVLMLKGRQEQAHRLLDTAAAVAKRHRNRLGLQRIDRIRAKISG